MATIDDMFELGIELRNKGQLRDSVNVFSKILSDDPFDSKAYKTHLVLGGVHADLGEHDKAITHLQKATELNPKSELSSLGLYVSLVKLDKDEEAIQELIRYLTFYPADLYKETLEELLEGLEQGYMNDYEDDIRRFAKANGVET